MEVQELMEELDNCGPDSEVFILVNGTAYPISGFSDDSQGVYIEVDTSDRNMR
jgi:hypothetical protein